MEKQNKILFEIEIDRLTNSIENTVSGDVFDTDIFLLTGKDSKQINKSDWLFNWQEQLKLNDRETYKLVIRNNPKIIQGLVSLSDRWDHIYMHLIESAKFNKGKSKIYTGVPGNLVAFACKLSFEKGYDGYVAFDAKTALVRHYQETLFATHFKGTKMMIETPAAQRLINQYFNK
ncbi:MAG: hypothetical protein Q7U54_09235 [Bacteroidales bacterium]|nr:hypothetical protein [Bacteroidales bacterium]